MNPEYRRHYDFSVPLDECWEVLPNESWSFDMQPGYARLQRTGEGEAFVYLRPCSLPGDTVEFVLTPGAPRAGLFRFGFISGFEYIRLELALNDGTLAISTHEAHKAQPRLHTRVPVNFHRIRLIRERDTLPGLPYEGDKITLVLDETPVACVGEIDYLPESLFMFGLCTPGEVSFAAWSISGPPRPRPEYAHVGLWQQKAKPTMEANVTALLAGVRQAAEAGVRILVTPETSLTGLRDSPDLDNPALIQEWLDIFQRGISAIPGAPNTLIGYPDWIDGSTVEGATLERVKVNCHRFVRPDGTLGPRMAKVHTCEEGFWHGRRYNLQRVDGVEVAMGVCHDGHYQDVWSTGVMGGARLCLHPMAGGDATGGNIEKMVDSYRSLGTGVDSFWLRVNAGGGAAIVYPTTTARRRDTILALPKDLTPESPTYPVYSSLGDLLAHTVIRLYDATGCYPMRTLRAGKTGYDCWSRLVPPLAEV